MGQSMNYSMPKLSEDVFECYWKKTMHAYEQLPFADTNFTANNFSDWHIFYDPEDASVDDYEAILPFVMGARFSEYITTRLQSSCHACDFYEPTVDELVNHHKSLHWYADDEYPIRTCDLLWSSFNASGCDMRANTCETECWHGIDEVFGMDANADGLVNESEYVSARDQFPIVDDMVDDMAILFRCAQQFHPECFDPDVLFPRPIFTMDWALRNWSATNCTGWDAELEVVRQATALDGASDYNIVINQIAREPFSQFEDMFDERVASKNGRNVHYVVITPAGFQISPAMNWQCKAPARCANVRVAGLGRQGCRNLS